MLLLLIISIIKSNSIMNLQNKNYIIKRKIVKNLKKIHSVNNRQIYKRLRIYITIVKLINTIKIQIKFNCFT